jgi:hypothetical protein
MEGQTGQQHQLPWDRTDRRPRPQLVGRGDRLGVDEQLAQGATIRAA